MSLPEDYTRYPLRKYGQDQDRHEWRPITERAPAMLPDGKALGVSIVVPLEFFMLNPGGKPFKHPGAMVTPYPDLRHYTTRDYGNRVGAYRLLDAFAKAGVQATFAVNAALLDRTKPLIADIAADGHELAAHGFETDSLHWGGVEPDIERRYVSETRKAFQRAGLTPRTWLSPARQQSFSTLDLVRAEGFDICLDWETDTVPVAMRTNAGEVRAFPLLNELDDRNLLIAKNHSEEEWLRQIAEAADMMKSQAPRHGASVFGFTMTPYISGLPYRMWAVREILAMLANDDKILCASVSTLTEAVKS